MNWTERANLANQTRSERGFLLVRSGAQVRILQFAGSVLRMRPRGLLLPAIVASALGRTVPAAWFQCVRDGHPDHVFRTYLFADGWEG